MIANARQIKRGDIIYADLSPVRGSEQGGLRPCVVVSNDIGNYHSTVVMIAPITTAVKHNLPTHHKLSREVGIIGTVLCEQIRCIDKSRIKSWKTTLTATEMKTIDHCLLIAFDL